MIYSKIYTEKDHGRWIDIINPANPKNELQHCIADAIKGTKFMEDFKIVFELYGMAFTPRVRYERISDVNLPAVNFHSVEFSGKFYGVGI